MKHRKKQFSESFFLYVLVLLILFTFLLSPVKNKNIMSNNLDNIFACRVRLSENQEIPSKTWTKLLFNVEDYDLGDNFNTSSHIFMVSDGGLYEINGNMYIEKLGKNNIFQMGIYINNNLSSLSIGLSDTTVLINDCIILDKNDIIELYVYHSNKKSISVIGNNYSNYMYIRRI